MREEGTYATGEVTAVLTLDGDVFCAAEGRVKNCAALDVDLRGGGRVARAYRVFRT
jgi:hypothetical protein